MAVDDLSLEQTIDRLGQGVVVTVGDAADRRLIACFGKTFRVADGWALGAPVNVVDRKLRLVKNSHTIEEPCSGIESWQVCYRTFSWLRDLAALYFSFLLMDRNEQQRLAENR